ncbi:sigma-54-dependent transcriptional regulator [Desulfocurvus sp. DL9XJH121]
MARVLIIDDDGPILNSLSRCFEDMGHKALTADSLARGRALAETGVDVIYLDLGLPDGDGREAIGELAAAPGSPEIIVLTGHDDNYGAREAMEHGAWDYIQKPASPASIRASLTSALGYRKGRGAQARPAPSLMDCGIIGESAPMQRAKQLIAKAAESEAGVLILGETGVGKELAAQAIHANSLRRGRPFIVVDCSNLSENLVESVLYGHVKGAFTSAHSDHRGLVAEADGGTLFLDEVGELPMSLQKSFLRVLQEHRFRPVGGGREMGSDFRLVAATNRDLEAMTEAGTFRSDLLFRLRTVSVSLPPLRERGGDVLLLAEHFMRRACERYGTPPKTITKSLAKTLTGYAWPGNVRELGNVMESAVIEAGGDPAIYPKHLPGLLRVSVLDKPKPAAQRRDKAAGGILTYADYKAMRDAAYFQHLMDICDNDVAEVSRMSGLSVPSVYRHLGLAGIATRKKQDR